MKSRAVLISLILIFLVVTLVTGFVLMLRLLVLAAILLLISYLWTRFSIRSIVGQRSKNSAEHCQVGGRFVEEITIVNNSWLPKPLIRVEVNGDQPGHRNMAIFNLSPKGSYRWQSEVHCQQRGRHTLGAVTATVSDPFGFFSSQRKLVDARSVLVYPATPELPFFQQFGHGESTSGYGSSSASEIGANAARVREYIGGDVLSHIHWRSTAHTGKLMVKEFDATRSNYAFKDVWIIIDMHQDSQVSHGNNGTEEHSVAIAASLIRKFIENNQRVGLIASADQDYFFPPEAGSQHLLNMLEALALMKATGQLPVEQLLSDEIERFGSNAGIIVITPSVSSRLIAPLQQAKQNGSLVTIISLAFSDFGGTAVNATGNLISRGFQVHVVKPGTMLASSPDNEWSPGAQDRIAGKRRR
ncbi:MAG: DUF58 domain-containing protein [Chloroflexi bacterium]|nr:DUF58 domain-containing protein [Chloroflexota bacterium]